MSIALRKVCQWIHREILYEEEAYKFIEFVLQCLSESKLANRTNFISLEIELIFFLVVSFFFNCKLYELPREFGLKGKENQLGGYCWRAEIDLNSSAQSKYLENKLC